MALSTLHRLHSRWNIPGGWDVLVVYSTQTQDPQQVENSGGLFLAPLMTEYVFQWFTPHLG
jgi:hypothetical protein